MAYTGGPQTVHAPTMCLDGSGFPHAGRGTDLSAPRGFMRVDTLRPGGAGRPPLVAVATSYTVQKG